MRSSLRRFAVVCSLFVTITLTALAASAYETSGSADAARPSVGAEVMAKLTYAILSAAGMTTLSTTTPSAF